MTEWLRVGRTAARRASTRRPDSTSSHTAGKTRSPTGSSGTARAVELELEDGRRVTLEAPCAAFVEIAPPTTKGESLERDIDIGVRSGP